MCHSLDWLNWPLSRLHRRNSDIKIIENHLKLVEEVHAFRLDPNLLNLEVCSFTFIHSKVLTRSSQNLKMQGKLIEDKMFEIYVEELGCICLISWAWGYRGDVFLPFANNLVLFGGLELHNELLKSANPIIIFCWKKRRKLVDDVSCVSFH